MQIGMHLLQQLVRALDDLLEGGEELSCVCSVDDAVVAGNVDLHDLLHSNHACTPCIHSHADHLLIAAIRVECSYLHKN